MYTNTSTETMVTGGLVEAGWFLSPSVTAGVEVGAPFQRTTLTQQYGYLFGGPYIREARYRERTVFFVVHGSILTRDRIRLDLAGGAGEVFASSLDRYRTVPAGGSVFDPSGPFGQETEQSHSMLGVTVGADLAFSAVRHLDVVSQFRLFVIPRGDIKNEINTFANLGLNQVVCRVGFGVRSSF
jgi:hypothetical protein